MLVSYMSCSRSKLTGIVSIAEEGSMGACNNAGLIWQTSRGEQPPDYSKAEEYFRSSCEGGF